MLLLRQFKSFLIKKIKLNQRRFEAIYIPVQKQEKEVNSDYFVNLHPDINQLDHYFYFFEIAREPNFPFINQSSSIFDQTFTIYPLQTELPLK